MNSKKGLSVYICVLIILGFLIKDILIKNEKEEDLNLEEQPQITELNLVMAGDALIHGALYRDARVSDVDYDFSYLFEYIEPLIKDYDLKFYNQETIIGGAELGYSSYPRFNTPHQFAEAMLELDFNLIALANNHTLDKGEKGIINSLNFWQQYDVLTAGTYLSAVARAEQVIKTKNNISYTLLAYTTCTNGLKTPLDKEYLLNTFDYDIVEADIKRWRSAVDLLIVSMHWGTEYTNVPNAEQKKIANFLADLDVDLVIGHHPHVIQPIEYIGETLVFYSLGNFVSAQKGVDRLTGMLGSVKITKTENKGHSVVKLSEPQVQFIYTYYQNWRNFKIYPFSKLNSEILSNYEQVFAKYSKIVTSLEPEILVLQ